MLNKIREVVIGLDHTIWYYMNTKWHNAFLDAIVPFLRNQYFWAPLYLFLLIFMPYTFGRRGWLWCIAYILSFALADQICVEVIKPFFHRIRPCNHPALKYVTHLVVECGSGYSFPSAHASNHFAMGIFSAVTIGRVVKWVWPLAIAWAFMVSFAQVYVGVHFPLDVTCGGLLGTAIGTFVGVVFNRYYGLDKPFPNWRRNNQVV